jgi:hypothetical protein
VSLWKPADLTEDNICLILLWSFEIGYKTIYGHHYITQNLGRTSLTEAAGPAFHLTIDAPSQIDHNFAKTPLLQVPISINVQNITNQATTFVIEALHSYESLSDSETLELPIFYWSGIKRQSFENVGV